MDDVIILYQVFSLLYDSQGSRKKKIQIWLMIQQIPVIVVKYAAI